MNQLIGIRTLDSISDVSVLKRDLIVFDKIVVVGLKEWMDVFDPEIDINSNTLLQKKGLITLRDFIIYQGYIWMKEVSNKLGGFESVFDKSASDEDIYRNQNLQYLIDKGKVILDYNEIKSSKINLDAGRMVHSFISDEMKKEQYQSEGILKLVRLCQDIKTRMLAFNTDSERYTAVSDVSSIYNVDGLTNRKSDVYNLIVDDFPMPSDKVSWEQIFDFKSDPEMYNSIWGLRNWVTKLSKSDFTISEIEEEYNYLKYKYQKAIRLHKLKTNHSIFQTVIQTSAELVENLAKLKFKSISDMVFSVKKNQVSLMEAELKSEGNQLAYLIKASRLK